MKVRRIPAVDLRPMAEKYTHTHTKKTVSQAENASVQGEGYNNSLK